MRFTLPNDELFDYLRYMYKDIYRGRIKVVDAHVEEDPADGTWSVKVTYRFSGPDDS